MYCKNVSKYRINTCISLFKILECPFFVCVCVLESSINEDACPLQISSYLGSVL